MLIYRYQVTGSRKILAGDKKSRIKSKLIENRKHFILFFINIFLLYLNEIMKKFYFIIIIYILYIYNIIYL